MWDRHPGGVVIELTALDPATHFHPAAGWTACPDGTALGDLVQAGVYSKPVPPAPTLAGQLAALATERYGRQTAGVMFQAANATAPALAASDPASTGMLTASYVAAIGGHWADGTPWKMADGSFVPLSSADMQAMALKVLGYIAACFAHEAQLAAALQTSLASDITAGWPANT